MVVEEEDEEEEDFLHRESPLAIYATSYDMSFDMSWRGSVFVPSGSTAVMGGSVAKIPNWRTRHPIAASFWGNFPSGTLLAIVCLCLCLSHSRFSPCQLTSSPQ